ncbi:MAG: ABC transporter permease [Fulvivirga sp.]|uniref:ABC transporter permease n=1 Tax=Fulvivirga sp. TaxID=1931237 RepID=UPI0032EB1B49
MIKNYLKLAFRSLWKKKTFVTINVLGLAVSIACCIVAYLNYDYDASFDVEHTNKENIYRLNSLRNFQGRITKHGIIPRPLGALAAENVSDFDKVANYINPNEKFRIEDELFNTNIVFTEPSFFEIFTFQRAQGQLDISENANIVISDELAQKYFGDEDPLGKVVTQVLDSGVRDYKVAGIFKKKPQNSSFGGVEAFASFENYYLTDPERKRDDWARWTTTFALLNDKSRIPAIENQLNEYIELQNEAREDFQITNFYLDPLVGMASRASSDNISGWTYQAMHPMAVIAPAIMAGLLLLLACFNFTNTSIAMAGSRLKEIGLRKVMGGIRLQLIRQFMLESLVLCFASLILGVIIAELLVPAYAQLWEFDLQLVYSENVGLFGFLVGMLVLTGLLAGSYPAFYISKFEPVTILKGTQKFGGTSPFTKVLLTGQLIIALLAIIASISFIQNAKYQKEFDMGYEGDGIIHVAFDNYDEYEVYKNAVANDGRIVSTTGSQDQLFEAYRNDPIRFEELQEEVDILKVDENYLETMNIRLTEGRNFMKDSETDIKESILVTKELVKRFKWDNPIGKRLVWADSVQLFVVGVIDDVYTRSLWNPLEPMILRMSAKDDYRFLTVNTRPSEVVEVNEYLEAKWKEIFPDRLYTGEYINIEITNANMVNKNIVTMFTFLGLVATILSVSGLFTLVSLHILKKLKEVAVRKVLGASVKSVVLKLNKQFFIIMLIAIVISSAISYFMIGGLMSSIWAYHVELGAFVFISSGLVFLLISTLTVGTKVYRAAASNPVNSLRNE